MKNQRSLIVTLALLLTAVAAQGSDSTEVLLARAWPSSSYAAIDEIGSGVGIVFTPDLSVKNNCLFYSALGFACFESADWREVIRGIRLQNAAGPGRPIRTLVLETHGTNGHGLKLQTGKKLSDARSYISVGALQEMLEGTGVRHIIISACNSGRLLRPEIYRRLNRDPGDKLFLPPTRGIIDATESFDPNQNRITVITPESSQIETTLIGSLRELAPATRAAIAAVARKKGIALPGQFAVSEMLIQMLLRDPGLRLRTGAHAEDLSRAQTTPEESERVFKTFVDHLNYIAARDARVQTASGGAK